MGAVNWSGVARPPASWIFIGNVGTKVTDMSNVQIAYRQHVVKLWKVTDMSNVQMAYRQHVVKLWKVTDMSNVQVAYRQHAATDGVLFE